MKDVVCIILAAGEGTRMKSETPKVLHQICGQAMIDYPINSVEAVGIERLLVVVGYRYDLLKDHLGRDVETIQQDRLLGTADAVARARSKLKNFDGDVLILYADAPLIRAQTLKNLISKHQASQVALTLLTSVVKNPTGYGRVVRDGAGRITKIVEEENASIFELAIEEVNAGAYSFRSKELFELIEEVKPDRKKKELFLTDIISLLAKRGERIESVTCSDPAESLGINTRSDLAKAERIMRGRILDELMEAGVTIVDPDSTYIDLRVKIGKDTIIYPQTYIECDVEIGRRCKIGPFARIRPGTRLNDEVSIGNFVELVRSKVGPKTKIRHFSYIGDCIIKQNVNIGAGTITANYDGKKKSQTFIEEGAFIGSGTILIAPVKVGRGAVTGAGCVVPAGRDVAPNTVVIGIPAKILKKREKRDER